MAYANRGEVDEQMAYELDGYIQSDGDLYRQKYLPIVKNLVNKMAQGKYDRGMAIKAFMYLVDDGAKKFHREFHYDVPWNVMANKATREEVAKSIRDSFEVEAKLGNWDHLLTKVSATKRAKSSANRSGSTQIAYTLRRISDRGVLSSHATLSAAKEAAYDRTSPASFRKRWKEQIATYADGRKEHAYFNEDISYYITRE